MSDFVGSARYLFRVFNDKVTISLREHSCFRTLLGFDNFQERRKAATESRTLTIKKIFRSPSMLASTSSGQFLAGKQQTLPEISITLSILSIFQTLSVTHYPPHSMCHQMEHPPDKCKVKVDDVIAEVEKYICICCYNNLFCASSDEEVADLSLQDRIRSLNWVTAGFLETKLDFSRQAVRNLLDDAIAEMIDINSHRRSDEKLECLVRCSHKIFEALKESGAPTSADEFLPVLIYVLLKGNPPLIQSNVKFISRFALPSRIMSGESGYFFTNLSCALQFVQDMNYASLKMERSEFEAYTSGDLVPPLNMMNCGCNQALGSMEESLVRVRELIERQHALSSRIDEIERRLSFEGAEMAEEFRKVMATYPSQEYQKLKEQIAREEKETMEVCSLTSMLSRSSRSSGESEEPIKEQATNTAAE
ncbi:vacuolar sorting protein 9 domain protein [Ostertagia ostertagi]